MSIIQAVRDYISACPFLERFTDGEYVDFTGSDAGNYGIMPTGEVEENRDFAGNVLNQYNFVLYARNFTTENADRVENSGFVEDFSHWIQDNNFQGVFPILPEGMIPESITCSNGSLFEFDENQNTGIYQIQCQLTYERKRKE